MMCQWITNQPCRLVIKSADGSPIDDYQQNSAHQISHILRTLVTISIEPILPSTEDRYLKNLTPCPTLSNSECPPENSDIGMKTEKVIPSSLSHLDKGSNLKLSTAAPVKPFNFANLASSFELRDTNDDPSPTIENNQNSGDELVIDFLSDASDNPSNDDQDVTGRPESVKEKESYCVHRKDSFSHSEFSNSNNNEASSMNNLMNDKENFSNFGQLKATNEPQLCQETESGLNDRKQSIKRNPARTGENNQGIFTSRGIEYYVISRSSGQPVSKYLLTKVLKENSFKDKTGNYRCLAHKNCNYITPRNVNITNHIFPVYFHIPCPRCFAIFNDRNIFYSHLKQCLESGQPLTVLSR